MAFTAPSLKLPLTFPPLTASSRISQINHSLLLKLPPNGHSSLFFHQKLRSGASITRAVEESQESTESEAKKVAEPPAEYGGEVNDIGAEIKKAMMERKKEKEENLWSGVAEEIQEIEWPVFGKVLGTTGVVLGVIAGSSVVLLTVNAVLAELSDRVFAGRGVQDFFG
ncbi:preprotein translocase subunit SECE1 [Euphorbia lathyris]|uniref:preprotein translocase subunit SECE1 n=1 Tax=Euphorbia lathyris TaxID=212925 RepID=UPI00331393DF